MKKIVSSKWFYLILLVIFCVFTDWFLALTYNIQKPSTYLFLGIVLLGVAFILFVKENPFNARNRKVVLPKTIVISLAAFILIGAVGGLGSLVVFRAKNYAAVMDEPEVMAFESLYDTSKAVEMSYVDKSSAVAAAEKKLGELSDVSSRFDIDLDEFSQVNYQGKMVRVAPFKYTDTFKQWINFSDGVPYYMVVTTGDGYTNATAEIVTLEEPMRYYPSAPLGYNLMRHVASQYKFSYIDDYYFEIDDQGHPYWLVQVVKNEVGLWGGKTMDSLLIVDAVSGDISRYQLDEVPEWVDTVYPTDMLLQQAQDHYQLAGGWFNSFLQQKGVMKIDQSEGTYNYVSIDDEIYLFTGIRPIKADSSSTTGLLFMSKRTGNTITLPIAGVSLTTAENTSIGSIQEKGYTPITPVLQNIGGYPTYVMSLKDDSGVVRSFAYVNYVDYTKSAVGTTLLETENNYLQVMGGANIDDGAITRKEAKIQAIQPVVIDGNTVYIISLEGDENIYMANININHGLAFLAAGQSVSLQITGTQIIALERLP